ncbi:hypothetical protein K469DRAFT_627819 [Zopfia rhizophila CBS 207.26]|uniref:P-loop containing nucleoside triphosphate hydrolase protein n=1 Tax=Zopfia rhizophila CBS 207.26 TaxID=1314779 RepID=A0A6A6E8J4_9PEZI|nr:hypothetical protein K469DRAFT_627819 [Zopfia rhizophila CBS 207.26]
MRIQSAEDARQKKRKRDQLKDREEAEGYKESSLFMDQESETNNGDDEEERDDRLDPDDRGSRKRRRPELPRKEPKQISVLEAERQSMRVALEADGDMPKKKRKGQPASDDSQGQVQKGKAPAKSKAPKSNVTKASSSKSKGGKKSGAKGGGRKSAKEKRNVQCAVNQMNSLFTGDVFAEQACEDAAEQPTFKSRNKQHALKELIASVPLEDMKAARTDMAVLLAATKDFDGRGRSKADGNGMWLVKGMKTSLKAYQLLGSAFMRRRENASEAPQGGLLADQMGLGKTLMMLANIVNGRPSRSFTGPKTTLLVAGPNLLTQWAREIETHTDANLTVMRYSSGTRIDSNRSFDILKQHDIVLTTYSEVMRSYPKYEPPVGCVTDEQKIKWWEKVYEIQRGELHRIVFLRVVLDEAQAIKNHMGRTSIACRALMAKHKWALSGTPVLNSLTELYPYFKFLDVPHTGSFEIFKLNYCNTSNSENTERLLVRLSQFMMRRTHADVMFGAPILKLPKADHAIHWCEFNEVERNVYDIVRKRFSSRINVWSQKGELDKSYGNMLVMLLRLRQLTAHILMLKFVMRDLLEREDIERIREVSNSAAADSRTFRGRQIIAIREQLKALAIEQKKRPENQEAGGSAQDEDDNPAEDNPSQAGPSRAPAEDGDENADFEDEDRLQGQGQTGRKFGKSFDFKPYLKSLTTGENWEKVREKSKCGKCDSQPPVNPYITSCYHLYCETCYQQMLYEAAENSRVSTPCIVCGQVFHFAHPCDPDGESDGSQGSSCPTTRSKSKKKKKRQPDDEEIGDDWLSLGGQGVLPSAKTVAIKAQILNWMQENRNVKLIIYTQFLTMRVILLICSEEGWGFELYHGKMSFMARDKAISNFADNPSISIMLASLRCGGVGLNLTMASRVIIVDPWWNNAVEQQAFCRVFRIGQKEMTFMTRFCVKNTVDQRLIDMQERKKKEIDEVMEADGSTVKKMSIRDLMRLFGPVADDKNGKPFIMVDNPDSCSSFRADSDDEDYVDAI